MIKLREIKKKDYKKVKHLFLRNKLKITDKINWINLWKNPIIQKSKYRTLGYVIENKNKIVGHIGLFPTEYRFKNKKLNCQVLHGWVIDKAYRNFSISLMNKFFSKNKSDFYLSTTTNKNAGKIMKALGWKKINLKGLKMIFPKFYNKRTQDIEETFFDAGQFYWGKTEAWKKSKPIFSKHSTLIEIPRWRIHDIDTIDDWKVAEKMWITRNLK